MGEGGPEFNRTSCWRPGPTLSDFDPGQYPLPWVVGARFWVTLLAARCALSCSQAWEALMSYSDTAGGDRDLKHIPGISTYFTWPAVHKKL